MKTRNNLTVEQVGDITFLIRKRYLDTRGNVNDVVDIAYIEYDSEESDCYIHTISSNFQDNIVVYEDFQDFIYLVDYAYDELMEMFK